MTGIAVGVFACFLLYLSGQVPPLERNIVATPVQSAQSQAAVTIEPEPEPEVEDEALDLEFYEELRSYEVTVDATPVPLALEEPEATPPPAIRVETEDPAPVSAQDPDGRLLQIGAFSQASSARRQIGMLEEIGVAAFVREEILPGRTLHLVQAGPFATSEELTNMRSFLQRNDINSFPLDPR